MHVHATAARTLLSMAASPLGSVPEPCARREAVAEALASVRAEGLEPGPECLERLEAIAEGRLNCDEAVAQLVQHYCE